MVVGIASNFESFRLRARRMGHQIKEKAKGQCFLAPGLQGGQSRYGLINGGNAVPMVSPAWLSEQSLSVGSLWRPEGC